MTIQVELILIANYIIVFFVRYSFSNIFVTLVNIIP